MPTAADIADDAYQDHILPDVSRTFALTIPQLPPALRTPVTSAYLLCRIADTIEDEPALSPADTLIYLRRFTAVAYGREPAAPLAAEVAPRLSNSTLPAEHDLVRNTERVIRLLNGFGETQKAAIRRCIEVMGEGMHHFQQTASVRGLSRSTDLDRYCYHVAGVVGEMLTELFCAYSRTMGQRRSAMMDLAASFGQGLQMTNILKDVWEDRARGACWLPQEVFSRHGIDLGTLSVAKLDGRFHGGMLELIGVAHGHLRNALAYTLLVPPEEAGIRKFCLWAIGLAVLTLRKIQRHPGFTSGAQVKVKRRSVLATRVLTHWNVRNDRMLVWLFEQVAAGLPLAAPSAVTRYGRAAAIAQSQQTADFPHPLQARLGGAGRQPDGGSVQ